MATLEEIVVQLTAETSQLRAELSGATKAVKDSTSKMDDAINEFSKNSGKNVSFFQQTMATMAGFLGSQAITGAFSMLKGAAVGLFGELQDGAQAAQAQEQAMMRLAQSMSLSGQNVEGAMDSMGKYIDEMEKMTGVGDDVVAANLAVMSSLTKLSAGGLQQAQTAALELSAALGKDLGTTTDMVAKAINGNDMAFKKLGMTMNLTEDTTKNLEIVTKALTDRFGGAAAASMNTYAGAILSLKNSYGNLMEQISTSVTSNQVFITMMKTASSIISSFTESLAGGGTELRNGIGEALLWITDILISFGQAADFAARIFRTAFNGIQTVVAGTIESILYLIDKIGGMDVGVDFSETKKQWDETTNSFSDSTGIDVAVSKLQELRSAGQKAFDEMKDKPLDVNENINKVGNSVVKQTQLTKDQAEMLKQYFQEMSKAQQSLSGSFEFQTQMMEQAHQQQMALLEDDYAGKLQAQQDFFAAQQTLRDEQFAKDNENLTLARNNELLTEEEFQRAKLELQQKYALDQAKQQTAITQFNAQQEKQRAENFKSTMGTISSLSSSSNKELAAIGKAAAITNATIDGYAAIQKAMASAPPPFNFALAAAVGAATAANVAKIAGVGLKGGIDTVPKSAMGGNAGDNFPAVLQPGERVVPKQTNQDLKEFLSNQGQGANVNVNVTVMPGTGLNNEQIGNLIEQMNNYFNSGGLKLIGAQ